MGNCCGGQLQTTSSMEWGGKDWGSLTSKHKIRTSSSKVFDQSDIELNTWEADRERLLGALKLKASSDEKGKLKIRISKKELEDLMAAESKIEKRQHQHQKAVEQVLLLRLINAIDHADEHHRPWRPVLQSIPEVN